MRPKMIVLVLLILLPAVFGFGQSGKETAWVIYDQGNAAFGRREYGAALAKYREALAEIYPFPEAEMGVGDVYVQEGELDLAIKQYRKAYELKSSLFIPEMKYELLYKLARIHETKLEYRNFEDSLKTIILDDRNFNPAGTSRLRDQFEANYYSKGPDFILKLYRFPEGFSAEAHAKLGWFYYRSGNFANSVLHLLYAVVFKIGNASRYALEKDADFQFTTISDFLKLAEADKVIQGYLDKTEVYKDMYYLAGSTHKAGYPVYAKTVWQILSKTPRAGQYAELSGRQLVSPWTEPMLPKPPAQN